MNRYVTYILIIMLLYSCQNNTEKEDSLTTADSTQLQLDTIEELTVHTPKFDYDTTRWLDIADLDPSIVIDMRYATADNFVEEKMYECGRCFLRPKAAREIVKIHQKLQTQGLGLKMFDCYRPKPIQQKLWDKVPDARYVTPPAKGSQHNRGLAVDLTIVDENGKQLNMGTKYDYFGKEGYHTYKDFEDKSILENRTLLLETMADFNFRHIRTEWWHYSYRGKVKHRSISSMLWDCEDNL
jgi:D-alanyl-D-alanine dipeptidase